MAFAKSTFKVKGFVIFRQTVATCRGSLDISFHLQKLPMYFWDFRINWQLVEIIFHLFWKAQCVAILSKVFFPTCQGSMLGSRPHCRSVPPVPVWLEEPVSQVRQSFSGGATNNPPFSKPQASTGKLAVKTGSLLPVRIPPQAEKRPTSILSWCPGVSYT